MDSGLSPSFWHRATLADQVAIPDREAASGYLPEGGPGGRAVCAAVEPAEVPAPIKQI
jgi:hypothetical protein